MSTSTQDTSRSFPLCMRPHSGVPSAAELHHLPSSARSPPCCPRRSSSSSPISSIRPQRTSWAMPGSLLRSLRPTASARRDAAPSRPESSSRSRLSAARLRSFAGQGGGVPERGGAYHVAGLGPPFWSALLQGLQPSRHPGWTPAVLLGLQRLGLARWRTGDGPGGDLRRPDLRLCPHPSEGAGVVRAARRSLPYARRGHARSQSAPRRRGEGGAARPDCRGHPA